MSIQKKSFGKLADGSPVTLFTLWNAGRLKAAVMNYGATLVSLEAPDRKGKPADVVLGFDTLEDYVTRNSPYFGCIVGRFANRIAKGRFTMDGVTYKLATNNGPNHLHGGLKGFDKVYWQAEASEGREPSVKFTYLSRDGEEGYPGNLSVTVTVHADRSERTADQIHSQNRQSHSSQPHQSRLLQSRRHGRCVGARTHHHGRPLPTR